MFMGVCSRYQNTSRSGAEVGASVKGKREEALQPRIEAPCVAMMMLSCTEKSPSANPESVTTQGAVTIAVPPPLLAAVFPWDRVSGTWMEKIDGRVALDGVPLLTKEPLAVADGVPSLMEEPLAVADGIQSLSMIYSSNNTPRRMEETVEEDELDARTAFRLTGDELRSVMMSTVALMSGCRETSRRLWKKMKTRTNGMLTLGLGCSLPLGLNQFSEAQVMKEWDF